MNIFDIFITYVSWGNSGKMRPVLILDQQEAVVSVFNITTQYENKSEAVRAKYFKITDWQQAGLDKQSYVDTGTLITLSLSTFENKTPIGTLTDKDKSDLFDFLNK